MWFLLLTMHGGDIIKMKLCCADLWKKAVGNHLYFNGQLCQFLEVK